MILTTPARGDIGQRPHKSRRAGMEPSRFGMTQRLWITAFFCGLSDGLISGCTLTRGHKDDSLVATGDGKPPPDLPDVAPPRTGEDKNDGCPRSENRHGIQQTRYSDDRINSVSGVPDDPTDYAKRRP